MSKQINLVINGKGGVEKSFFASNFVQYLKDCGIAHCAIDSDRENAILKRFIAAATPDVAAENEANGSCRAPSCCDCSAK